MTEGRTFDPPLEIPTLTGALDVFPSEDHLFAIFSFETPTGPVRIAVRKADLPRLIATAAHAYSPEMPVPGRAGPGLALPVSDWSIIGARGDGVAFSFELAAGAALTFLVPAARREGLAEALATALGPPDPMDRRARV